MVVNVVVANVNFNRHKKSLLPQVTLHIFFLIIVPYDLHYVNYYINRK